MTQVIVVGGGLAGLSAAHTVLEQGGRVLLLDKSAFLGGNSTKATSGINGTPTRTQREKKIPDSVEAFLNDTAISAAAGKTGVPPSPLARVLVEESGPAVEWLTDNFGLDLSLVSQLGGHSFPRTHRGKEKFPGFTITYALMEALEKVCEEQPDRARLVCKARVTELVSDAQGNVVGVKYEHDGKVHTEHGYVIVATGGYAADFTDNGILMKVRPDLKKFSTTNGEHCTGDGIKFTQAVGGGVVDLHHVQVHPTGLVHPDDPGAKVKWLAAEALRGVGALIINADGKRFVNELGRRDFVSGEMAKNKGPFRLLINPKGYNEISWHIKHYMGRGVMKEYANASALAQDMKISPNNLSETLNTYSRQAAEGKDPFGKKFFHNIPFKPEEKLYVALIEPVVHYCMGGLHIDPKACVVSEKTGKPVGGLWAAGEVAGGVHGINRLGGSSLLDCVVYGRVAGRSAAAYLLSNVLRSGVGAGGGDASAAVAGRRLGNIVKQLRVDVAPTGNNISITLDFGGGADSSTTSTGAPSTTTAAGSGIAAAAAAADASDAPPGAKKPATADKKKAPLKTYTKEEVAKHNKENDCWVIINGQVLDATSFLNDHPGGARVILLYAGQDASEEFNMVHKANVVEKYAPHIVIGTVAK